MFNNYRSILCFCCCIFTLCSNAEYDLTLHYMKGKYTSCDHDTYSIAVSSDSKCIGKVNPWITILSGSYDPSIPVTQTLEVFIGSLVDYCTFHFPYQIFRVQSALNPYKVGFFKVYKRISSLLHYADSYNDPYGIIHIPASFTHDKTIYIGVDDRYRKCGYKNICIRGADLNTQKAGHFGLYWDNSYFDLNAVDFYVDGELVKSQPYNQLDKITVGDFEPGKNVSFMVKWIVGDSRTVINSNMLTVKIPPLWDQNKKYEAGAKVQHDGSVYCTVKTTPQDSLPALKWEHCNFLECNNPT